MGLHETFDVDYWQLFDQYVTDGLCPSSWINDLTTVQNNVFTAIKGYAEWKNANPSDGKLSFLILRIISSAHRGPCVI